jgi:hypothetical protein
MTDKLKDIMQKVERWPEKEQAELASYVDEIESRNRGQYHATADELTAIDKADQARVASDEEVADAFRTFRQA